MTDLDCIYNEEAHKYAERVKEPLCDADIVLAFKAGMDAMQRIMKLRHPYNWGVKTTMLNMKVGQVLKLPYEAPKKMNSFRTNATHFKNEGWGIWSVRKQDNEIVITRTE